MNLSITMFPQPGKEYRKEKTYPLYYICIDSSKQHNLENIWHMFDTAKLEALFSEGESYIYSSCILQI
jgi:hypothetical protein